MENKTAVEWLVDCIESMDWKGIKTRKELYDKAKEMEKSQIIESANVCCGTIELSKDNKSYNYLSGEQFYKMRYIQKII